MTEAVRQEENNNSDIPQRRDAKQTTNQKNPTNAYISPPARGPRHGEIRWQSQSASIMWPAVSPNLQLLRPRSSITLENVCIPSSPTQTLSQFFLPSIAITRHEFSGQLQNQLPPTVKTS
jgi:hypothetical protein